ncbi:MAG: anaerobic ribonucleoside-triphosphate reductase [Porphyromonadaceae bacterium]|nr:anaerobic ribonucleoside-triphosphate reductase [Porphyromonadaceae bacterium]
MESKQILIEKRDGKRVPFALQKIENAISKAFISVGSYATSEDMVTILSRIRIHNGIKVEEIQNQVETALMAEKYFAVAKSFMLYREKRREHRELLKRKAYISNYIEASNAATGSLFDANANVTEKNIATLNGELFKGDIIKLNRSRLADKIREIYGVETAKEYIRQLESHELYKHDETSIFPYCVAITMYPMLTEGLTRLGGISTPPKHLRSFCGIFVNLVFTIASQFAGAVATPEFLMYFDYFCRKEWGDDYYLNEDKIVETTLEKNRSIKDVISDYFQNVVYYLNQPAAARNFQSVFWNISYFDKYYFEGIFGDFYFPNGTKPRWDSLDYIQRLFMKWFNRERNKSILTFPVETMALLTDGEDVRDKEYGNFTAEMYSQGHSFFTYMSNSPDSLSSCCRLRNEVKENQFSYSLGAGGVATGSKSVMTLNINRLVQDAVNNGKDISSYLIEQVKKVHKYQTAFNELQKEFYNANMLTVYKAGFISLEKQYLTIGVNGVVEAAEFLGITPSDNPEYKQFIQSILKTISDANKMAKTNELMFNTEFVPAENLGVKHANWDKEDGYFVPRECYNSYFYAVEDTSLNILDKFKMHGKDYVQYLDGGSALHMNLEEHLSKAQYRALLRTAAIEGTNYFTFNIPNTICNECGYIDKRYLKRCSKCKTENVGWATRVIGYLKRIENFSEARQREAERRYYFKEKHTTT